MVINTSRASGNQGLEIEMTFTQQNTDGYTDKQLAALNAELAKRLAGLDRDSDEYQQAEKAFADEVASR